MANEFTQQQTPAPYVFQEFPKTLYSKEGAQKTVRSKEEQDAAGKEWSEKVVMPAPAAEAKTADLAEAIADLRRQTGEAILALTERVSALEGGEESESKQKQPHRK